MQTRTITVDYARPRGYDVGYSAENNFTLLALPVPEELEGADSYRVYFESTVGEYLQTELLTPADGYVTVKITSDIVPEPGNMAAQLVAFADGEIVGYAPMITGSAKVSIPDGTERLSHSLAAEIALNTAARHSHANKSVLDKFAESKDGKPTYDGKALGDGSKKEIFKIPVTVTELEEPADGESFKVEHTVTLAELEEATKEGKTLTVLADRGGVTYALPLLYYYSGTYLFYLMMAGTAMYMVVGRSGDEGETPKEVWQYQEDGQTIGAENVSYYNRNNTSIDSVKKALDELLTDSHTHKNKAVLDLLSAADGKLKYNGSDVGLKGANGTTPHIGENGNWYIGSTDTGKQSRGDKGDPGSDANVTKTNVVNALGYTPQAVSTKVATGTNTTLADNTEYRLTDVTTLTLNYPTGDFECWMRLKFAASGNITVTLPADTKYIGTAPDFKNGETWELSFKDKVLAAQKVGEGT